MTLLSALLSYLGSVTTGLCASDSDPELSSRDSGSVIGSRLSLEKVKMKLRPEKMSLFRESLRLWADSDFESLF